MASSYRGLRKKWNTISKDTANLIAQSKTSLEGASIDAQQLSNLIAELEDNLKSAEEIEYRILPMLDNDEDEQDRFIEESVTFAKTVREHVRKLKQRGQPSEASKCDTTFTTDSPAHAVINMPHITAAIPNTAAASLDATPLTPTSAPNPQDAANTIPHTASHRHRFNLPKLHLPKFDGNALQWLSFTDKFHAVVGSDQTLAPVEKMQYLTAHLTGDAAQLVEGLPISNNNYEHAMQLLKNRYGKPDMLISTYINAIINTPPPSKDADSLRLFHDKVEANIRSLTSLGEINATNSTMLVSIIKQKLPYEVQTQLYRENSTGTWDITQLMQALLKEINAKYCGNVANSSTPYETSNYATASFVINARRNNRNYPQQNPTSKCVYCSQHHLSAKCTTISDVIKRKELLKQQHRCFNCLSSAHAIKNCPSKFTCRSCRGKHHTSICLIKDPQRQEAKNGYATQRSGDTDTHVALAPTSNPTLLKTAAATIQSGTRKVSANILFDEGSQRTFITKETAQHLQINLATCPTEVINLSTFGEKTTKATQYPVTQLNLLTRNGHITLSAIIVPSIAAPLRNYIPQVKQHHKYLQYLQLATHTTSEKIPIDMLIGADYFWSIVSDKIIRGPGPTAVASKLGFLLSGPAKIPNLSSQKANIMTTTCLKISANPPAEISPENIAAKYWDLETLGIREQTQERKFDAKCYSEEQITQDVDGKYMARLPWKSEHAPLPTNFALAYARTRAMISRLDAERRTIYDNIIQEQLRNDFIELVPIDNSDEGHYIPHHSVTKPGSTTPIRVVYDCSCAAHQSPSLNECLETGPDLAHDMLAILLRFRTHAIALTSDIEKAFLNIRLHPDDRDFTKFFWLTDPTIPNSDFCTYRFKSVLFGSTSSPFILNAVLQKHLARYNTTVADDIRNNLYVDNLLTGVRGTHSSSVSFCTTDQQSSIEPSTEFWLPEFLPPSNDPITTNAHLCETETCERLASEAHLLLTASDEDARISAVMRSEQSPNDKSLSQCIIGLHNIIDVNRFSSLDSLLRTTAQIKRFVRRLRSHQAISTGITADDVIDAEQHWIRDLQHQYFTKEALGHPTSLVRQLRLFIDNTGLLRSKHRLDNSSLPFASRYLLLLPTYAAFTTLLIRRAHMQLLHAGVSSTVTHLRQTYWIPKLRQRVASVIRKCAPCLKVKGKAYATQSAPPLPACRILVTPPSL